MFTKSIILTMLSTLVVRSLCLRSGLALPLSRSSRSLFLASAPVDAGATTHDASSSTQQLSDANMKLIFTEKGGEATPVVKTAIEYYSDRLETVHAATSLKAYEPKAVSEKITELIKNVTNGRKSKYNCGVAKLLEAAMQSEPKIWTDLIGSESFLDELSTKKLPSDFVNQNLSDFLVKGAVQGTISPLKFEKFVTAGKIELEKIMVDKDLFAQLLAR